MCGDGAIDPQAGVGPAANPFAIVKIGVTGVAVAYVSFVVAPAGAYRPRPADVAIGFRIDVAPPEKVRLASAIDPRAHVPQPMRVRIDEAMARRDVTRRAS